MSRPRVGAEPVLRAGARERVGRLDLVGLVRREQRHHQREHHDEDKEPEPHRERRVHTAARPLRERRRAALDGFGNRCHHWAEVLSLGLGPRRSAARFVSTNIRPTISTDAWTTG